MGLLVKMAPSTAMIIMKANCNSIIVKFFPEKTFNDKSEKEFQENDGTGSSIPEIDKRMINAPNTTTAQSSVSPGLFFSSVI